MSLKIHPSKHVVEEMIARGWSFPRMVKESGIEDKLFRKFSRGEHPVTREIALGLSEAFGTGPEIWLNLQNGYDKKETP